MSKRIMEQTNEQPTKIHRQDIEYILSDIWVLVLTYLNNWNRIQVIKTCKWLHTIGKHTIDVSADNCKSVLWACKADDIDRFTKLLQDERVKSKLDYNGTLYNSFYYHAPKCAEYMLSNGIHGDNRQYIYYTTTACEIGAERVFKKLLDLLSEENYKCLGVCITFAIGCPNIVKIILGDTRFDIELFIHHAFSIACGIGDLESIKLFQVDKRFSSYFFNTKECNRYLDYAVIYKHTDVVEHVKSDKRYSVVITDKKYDVTQCSIHKEMFPE